MDRQILPPVLIVHIHGDVKVDAAHGVDELDKHLDIKDRIAVDPVAEELLHAGKHCLHTVSAVVFGCGIVLIHFLGPVGHVHRRVTRNADEFQRFVLRIEHTDEHRIRQAGRAVLARDQEGIAALLASLGIGGNAVVGVAVAQAAAEARRADPVIHQYDKLTHEQRQHNDHDDRNAHFFLLPALILCLLRLHAVIGRGGRLGKRVVLKAAAVVISIVIARVLIAGIVIRIAAVILSSFHILFPCLDTSLMPAPCSRAV